MAATRKTWVYSPSRPAKPSVPEAIKADVTARARELVESELKPRHIEPPPDNEHLNYIVDIGTRWYRDYFYFFATYKVPGPTAPRTMPCSPGPSRQPRLSQPEPARPRLIRFLASPSGAVIRSAALPV